MNSTIILLWFISFDMIDVHQVFVDFFLIVLDDFETKPKRNQSFVFSQISSIYELLLFFVLVN